MTAKQAFKVMKKKYPGRTFHICTNCWHSEAVGDYIDYRVTLFSLDSDSCEGYDGKALKECLEKLDEAENPKRRAI